MIDHEMLRSNLRNEDRFYWQMVLIRTFEARLLDLFKDNQIFGTTHTSIGQEADAVAVVGALDQERDTIWSSHRCHGHFLAYCGQLTGLAAEILGRDGGVCRGRGGSQHLSYGRFHSSGVQGGLVPLALGTAMADREDGAISTVFLGDGTMGEGVVYEGLNLASLWSLPVLFVVEDNGIAQTTPRALGVSGSVTDRAKPFGIRSFHIEDTDPLALHEIAREAVAYVRGEGRPAWLHIQTVRLGPHSKGDDTRSEDELAELRKRDPITLLEPRVSDPVAFQQEALGAVNQAFEEARRMAVACG